MADEERDNRFHSLQVRVDRPGLQVFHRQGYYAGAIPTAADLVAEQDRGTGSRVACERAPRDAGTLAPSGIRRLYWFYAGTNRASVHLSVLKWCLPE